MKDINLTQAQQEFFDLATEKFKARRGGMIVVSGAAGCGKSYVSALFLKSIQKELKSGEVIMTASTHKACSVISRFIAEQSLFEKDRLDDLVTVITLQKLMYVSVPGHIDYNTKKTTFISKLNEPEKLNCKILIVDEASQLSANVISWIRKVVLAKRVLVILLGDQNQLPPVEEEVNISRIVGNRLLTERHDILLTEVKRSSKSLIPIFTGVRELVENGAKTKEIKRFLFECNEVNENFSYIKLSGMSPQKYLTENTHIKNEVNCCYTNKLRENINLALYAKNHNVTLTQAKNAFPGRTDLIVLGDNCNPLGLYNGSITTIEEMEYALFNCDKRDIILIPLFQGKDPLTIIGEEYWGLEIAKRQKDAVRLGKEAVVQQKALIKQLVNEEYKRLESDFGTNPKLQALEIVKQFKYSPKIFLKQGGILNDLISVFIELNKMPSVYYINCDFGYCITTHKAQGSEFNSCTYILEKTVTPQHIYTGITRAKDKLLILEE